MNILELVSTVMDLSQKEEECSEEIRSINATLISLKMAIGELHEQDLPKHLRESLSSHLSEAHDLVLKVTSSKNWLFLFKNIKYLIPGSDLHKLKEKNAQLIQDIHLINLHLNSRIRPNSFKNVSDVQFELVDGKEDTSLRIKKIKTADSSKNGGLEAITCTTTCNLNSNLLNKDQASLSSEFANSHSITSVETTQSISDQALKRAAFTVRFLFNQEVFDKCDKDLLYDQKIYWNDTDDTCEFLVQRNKYLFLPKDVAEKISKNHLIIKGKWEPYLPEDSMIPATFDDRDMSKVMPPPPSWKFQVTDLSTNGTFLLKAQDAGFYDDEQIAREIKGEFERLEKGEPINLEDGDVIAIVTKKAEPRELLFGFQLLVYKF